MENRRSLLRMLVGAVAGLFAAPEFLGASPDIDQIIVDALNKSHDAWVARGCSEPYHSDFVKLRDYDEVCREVAARLIRESSFIWDAQRHAKSVNYQTEKLRSDLAKRKQFQELLGFKS